MSQQHQQPEDGETHDLRADAQDALRVLATEQMGVRAPVNSERDAAHSAAREAIFEDHMALRLEVQGSDLPILLSPGQKEKVLGRRDPVAREVPDVDLTAYAAYQMGLSRRHAAIQVRDRRLVIWDLGSRNGTYLNGKKLNPREPQPVCSGDEILLGKMVIRVLFQRSG